MLKAISSQPSAVSNQRLTTDHERGAALLLTFLMMLVLTSLAVAAATFSQHSLTTGKSQLLDKQAWYIAEAGWQRSRQAIVAGTWSAAASPGNSYTESFGAGTYIVTVVDNGGNSYTITSEGYVPSSTNPSAKRKVTETSLSVTTSDGSNSATSATATASSAAASHPATDANDGSTSTHWQASTAGDGQWLKLDYSASPPTLTKIVILENANIADNGVTLEWSDNNSSWTTLASGSSVIESPSQTWTATFSAISHRYLRATFNASGASKKVAVKELQSYNSSISSLGHGAVTTTW